MRKIFRLLLLLIGLCRQLATIANNGARDIENRLRFKQSIIDHGCCIDKRTMLNEKTHILSNCIINNSKIGRFSYVGRNSIVQNANIGSFCSISNEVMIGLGKHPEHMLSTSPLFYKVNNTFDYVVIDKDSGFVEYEHITIGNDVWIGAKVTILDGVKLGNGAIIGTGAVVTRDVPPYAIVAGVPAKVIKYRFKQDKIDALLKLNWWDMDLCEIKKLDI